MRRRQVAELSLFVMCVALLACHPRVALRDKPVDSIDVRFDRAAMCPGETAQLSIYAKLKDGKVVGSENTQTEERARWDSYRVAFNGAAVEQGEVQVPEDPLQVQIP